MVKLIPLPSNRTLAIAIVAAMFALVPGAFSVVAQDSPRVPCGDLLGRGCPDLTVDGATMNPSKPHVKHFKENTCVVQEGTAQPGDRTLVYFTYTTPNLGPGDVFVGDPEAHPEWFEYDACHDHFHFREYADYRVWTPAGFDEWDRLRRENPDLLPADILAARPDLASQMTFSGKRGFCIIDIWPYFVADPPKYNLCNFQGISVGWADEYHDDLDGQFVDVTGLASGTYVLEEEVNPERMFVETDYTNNRAWVPITI